jgi:predicted alpha/beta hydrolase
MISPEAISISLSDGEENSITIFRAHQPTVLPVLVILPALGVKGSYYRNVAQHFAAHHYHVVTIDHRGHGHSSVRPSSSSDFGYREQIELEYAEIFRIIKNIFSQSKIVIIGHSLGGQMGSMFIGRYTELADAIILNASCSTYHKGWGPVAGKGLYLFALFCRAISKILGYYPGNRIGFGNVEAAGVMRDWQHTATNGKFAAHGSAFDYEKSMANCVKPVLGITYEGDTSAPPLALKYLTSKFKNAPVRLLHLKPTDTIQKKYNHYSWAREPHLSFSVIDNWIKENF